MTWRSTVVCPMFRCMAASLLAMMLFTCGVRADDAPQRTWTDATGKHKVVAALLAVRAGDVYLKRSDGKVVTLPVARLSKADQEFLKSLEADKSPANDKPSDERPSGKTTSRDELLSKARASTVVVRTSPRAGSFLVEAGVIIRSDEKHHYVLSSTRLLSYGPENLESKRSFTVNLESPDGKSTTVEGKLLGIDDRLLVLRIKSDGKDRAIALPKHTKIDAGSRLRVIGREVKNSIFGRFPPVEKKAFVHSSISTAKNSLPKFSIQGDDAVPMSTGLVYSADGLLLGVVVSRSTSSKTAQVVPTSAMRLLGSPQLRSVNVNAKAWSAKQVTFRVSAQANDPFARSRTTTLLLKPITVAEADAIIKNEDASDEPLVGDDVRSIDFPQDAAGALSTSFDGTAGGIRFAFAAQLRFKLDGGKVVHSRVTARRVECTPGDPTLRSLARLYGSSVQRHGDSELIYRWKEFDALISKPTKGDFPRAVKADESHAQAPTRYGEMTVYSLSGLSLANPRFGPRLSPAWSADGKLAYFMSSDGMLREVTVPEFRTVRTLSIPDATGVLVAKNLLVLTQLSKRINDRVEGGSLWFVDPKSLVVRGRVTCPIYSVAARPDSDKVYAFGTDLWRFDAAALDDIKVHKIAGDPSNRYHPFGVVVSPDGRYLLSAFNQSMIRFRVEVGGLVCEEASSRVQPQISKTAFSADGKHFTTVCTRLRSYFSGRSRSDSGVAVFDLQNLKRPLSTFAAPSDRNHGLEYDQNGLLYEVVGTTKPPRIDVLDSKGEKRPFAKNLTFIQKTNDPTRVLFHPTMGAMLVETRRGALWCVFSKAPDQLRKQPARRGALLVGHTPKDGPAKIQPLSDWVKNNAKPQVADFRVGLKKRTVNGQELIDVSMPKKPGFQGRPSTDYVYAPYLSRDKKSIYLALSRGRIAKIDAKSLKPNMMLDPTEVMIRGVDLVAESKSYLLMVITSSRDKRLLVLDPDSLQIKNAYPVTYNTRLLANSDNDTIAVFQNRNSEALLSTIDLATGEVKFSVSQEQVADYVRLAVPGIGNANSSRVELSPIAPDLAVWRHYANQLHVFRIAENGIAYIGSPTRRPTNNYLYEAGHRMVVHTTSENGKRDGDWVLYALDKPEKVLARFETSYHTSWDNLRIDRERKRIYTRTREQWVVLDFTGKEVSRRPYPPHIEPVTKNHPDKIIVIPQDD